MSNSEAVFQAVTRAAGSDVPYEFDVPSDMDLSGATLALRMVNVDDATEVLRSDGGSLSAPTYSAITAKITGAIASSITTSRGGKTYRLEIWRIDTGHLGRLIRGNLTLDGKAIQP